MTRQQIHDKISANQDEIARLQAENAELNIQDILLCDDTQWFEEGEELITVSKRPKRTETQVRGYRCWGESFIDESTKEVVVIDRRELVRINGEWI